LNTNRFRLTVVLALVTAIPAAADVEFFEKKIRPILVEQCQSCHGAAKQKGGLRLDSRAAALKGGDTGPAMVPGKADPSLLIQAVRYVEDLKMPPKGKLTDEQIADLTKWVNDGAAWPDSGKADHGAVEVFDLKARLAGHWAYQPVRPQAVPNGASHPVDAFLLQKLREKGLSYAPAADKRTLIRRLTFDLTGLPPTPAEVTAFLNDASPNAYETLVDRLLASPRYGERWARHWLDLVRYAETQGHEFDFEIPDAWRYRDYAIRAFNDDLPYDALLREHLAGDLLAPRVHPTEKTNEALLATSFWFLGEGVHSPVDVRQNQADRIDNQIDVFAKTFLGLTVSCARCHDHKFDAITTKDYYALYGILSSSRYNRTGIDDPASRRVVLERLIAEQSAVESLAVQRVAAGIRKALAADGLAMASGELGDLARLAPTGFSAGLAKLKQKSPENDARLAAWKARSKPVPLDGWTTTGDAFGNGSPRIVTDEAGTPIDVPEPSAGGTWPSGKLSGALRSKTFTIDSDHLLVRFRGKNARANIVLEGLQLIQDPIYGSLKFGINSPTPKWHAVRLTSWKGRRAYLEILAEGDGHATLETAFFAATPEAPPETGNDKLRPMYDAKDPAELRTKLSALIEETLVAWENPNPLDASQSRLLDQLLPLAKKAPFELTADEQVHRERFANIERAIPAPRRAVTMAEGTPADEKVFIRGNHKTLGEPVSRRYLEGLGGSTPTGSGRRELADKLTDPTNPLVARVFVNRIWKHHFGEGLVRSPDDFGLQGQRPTHPELLDWVASDFIRSRWKIKRMHKQLLMTDAYRQSSTPEPMLAERAAQLDAKNELLHAMPVRRLEAEAIRDAVLAISGRLDTAMGGPGVPPHLTPFMIGRGRPGGSGPIDGAGRRSIYLQVRRNFLNPMFLAFDYPTPFTTIGRRGSSNVPAQGLTLMNNPLLIQEADRWAKSLLADAKLTDDARINSMYERAYARPATADEITRAKAFLVQQAGEYPPAERSRAWSDLAHVLFNVKEFVFLR
jgi:mono/diheme cytochrome c family protein